MDFPYGEDGPTRVASSTSSSTSRRRYFNPVEFFSSMPNHPRRSSRSSTSRRSSSPMDLLTDAISTTPTRSSAGIANRLESLETQNVAVGSSSTRSSSRGRKRKHQGAENPEGPEVSTRSGPTASRPSGSSKRRRTTRTPKPKKSIRRNLKAPPPSAKGSPDIDDGDKKPAAKTETAATENCCICMCDVGTEDISQINGCDHHFCFACIEKWAERENTCPLCKCRFTKIDRVNKKRKKGAKNSKKVKQRDQRSDLLHSGVGLEGLLASIGRGGAPAAGLARIVFGMTSSSTGPFGSSNAGAATNPLFNLAERDDDDSAFSLFRTFNTASAPGSSGGFRFAAYAASGAPSASFSIQYSSQLSAAVPPSAPPVRVRSHATNDHDATAGYRLDNPLEIADSDDDDDAIEVLEIS